jgi:DNA-binding Lrp family transcriptional regulator
MSFLLKCAVLKIYLNKWINMDEKKNTSSSIKLDAMDKKIIYELEQNSRRSLGLLAKKVQCSKEKLRYRVNRMVKAGVISGFITAINSVKLGYTDYTVWMQLDELSQKRKMEFINHISNQSNTRWVAKCGGKFDVAFSILARDIRHYDTILKEILKDYPDYVKNYYVNISYEYYSYPKTYLVKNRTQERTATYLAGTVQKYSLDKADQKILKLLATNSRIETVELAKKTNLSPNTVRSKIKLLEKERIIQRYSILIQPSKMGIENYEVLVSLHSVSGEKLKQIESFCLKNKYVIFFLKTVGEWDVNFTFDTYSTDEFQALLTSFRSQFSEFIKDYDYTWVRYVYKFNYFPFKIL